MDGVALEVAGDSLAIPLKVGPDRTFTLERNPVALKENAQVMPNRKAGTMTWRADVRTPGLPPNTRRLGDLRLECEVGMKSDLISRYPRRLLRLARGALPRQPGLLPPRQEPLPLLRRPADLERDAGRRRAPRSAPGRHALRRRLPRSEVEAGPVLRLRSPLRPHLLRAARRYHLAGRHAGQSNTWNRLVKAILAACALLGGCALLQPRRNPRHQRVLSAAAAASAVVIGREHQGRRPGCARRSGGGRFRRAATKSGCTAEKSAPPGASSSFSSNPPGYWLRRGCARRLCVSENPPDRSRWRWPARRRHSGEGDRRCRKPAAAGWDGSDRAAPDRRRSRRRIPGWCGSSG